MTKGYVRPARWEDVPTLAADLRSADIAELRAASGLGPQEAISVGVRAGETYVACLPDDTPAFIFGVTEVVPKELGGVWAVATNRFKEIQMQFLRESREATAELCRPYRLTFNYTDARNKLHHRWIKWCGFTFIKRHEQFGAENRPFLEFVRITENQHVC